MIYRLLITFHEYILYRYIAIAINLETMKMDLLEFELFGIIDYLI